MRFFSHPQGPYRLGDPPSLLSNWYWCPCPEEKQLEQEFDHSNLSRSKVKYKWSYTSIPLFVFTAWIRTNLSFINVISACDKYSSLHECHSRALIGVIGEMIILKWLINFIFINVRGCGIYSRHRTADG
jgi:hypothetical protein